MTKPEAKASRRRSLQEEAVCHSHFPRRRIRAPLRDRGRRVGHPLWARGLRAEFTCGLLGGLDIERAVPRGTGPPGVVLSCGADKGQQFWTVLSDAAHGEVIGVRKNRDETSATALLTQELTARQRAAVTAVCTDMHRPYLKAGGTVLKQAAIVFDKFHVLQHASAALDEVRRQAFFRAGAVLREHGRGKRWLLLRRWKTVRGSKRAELHTRFAANRRLFKAYVLREQLDRLWTYKTRPGVSYVLLRWIKALRCQRLPEMERLGDFLFPHIEGIAAYCDHPVRFGVVVSIDITIKAVRRRGRAACGMKTCRC